MGTSQELNQAAAQATQCQPGKCKACERKGLPILPLRRALTPAKGDTQPGSATSSAAYDENGLRALRAGYLYVLLDKRVWQAYQVTPEGALRQFNPLEPPRGEAQPLTQTCIKENHDVPAAFLNIDTQTYKQAQIAFANDPWPQSVLDAYKSGKAPASRFTTYDLAALKANPATVANAMAFTQGADLSARVWEYAPSSKDFGSVHGFTSRAQRLQVTQAFAAVAVKQYALAHGVPVVLLPDPIGMVQEYNHLRARLLTNRQEWAAESKRSFQWFTSQALLGIKQLEQQWSEAEATAEVKANAEATERYNRSPMGAKAGRLPVNVPAETERVGKEKTQDAHERLEERYDENGTEGRKAFQDSYDAEWKKCQAAIDRLAERYAAQFCDAPFQTAAEYDYTGADTSSGLAFTRTLSQCLSGGPSEGLPQAGAAQSSQNMPAAAALGATQRLWKAQLEKTDSLLYKALLAKDQNLLQLISDGLEGDDKGKLYDTIKGVIGTEQGQKAMVEPVQTAIGQLLAATTSAANALAKHLSPTIKTLVGNLHSAAHLRYSGQRIIEVVIDLSVGEYLTLLGDALHDRADELVGGFQSAVAKPAARKVRAMVMSGALTIATARNSRTLVPITVWALESAESLKQRLDTMRAGARANVGEVLRNVRIGADTLEKGAANVFKTLQLDARAARQFAGNAMRSLRTGTRRLGGAAPDLLLSLGSLWFQQDSLGKNLDAIAKAPGAGRDEAIAVAWSSSVGVMGVGVELSGITLKALRPDITTAVKASKAVELIPLGARMAQYGGAIGAVAGIMDGVQYAWAANRVSVQGDTDAATAYKLAEWTSFGAAGFGIVGAMALEATLLGPLGWALVIGLVAYGMAQWAKRLKSTPLELWARHSPWGLPADRRQWKIVDASNQPLGAEAIQNNYNTAVAALNAAVLGVTAEAAINQAPRVVGIYSDAVALGPALQYAISLPGYDPAAARYSWALVVTRYNGTQVIAAGRNDGAPLKVQAPAKFPDYDVAGAQPIAKLDGDAPGQHTLSITGSIELNFNHSVTALAMVVEYWPDKSDEDGYARLTIVQSKLDQTGD